MPTKFRFEPHVETIKTTVGNSFNLFTAFKFSLKFRFVFFYEFIVVAVIVAVVMTVPSVSRTFINHPIGNSFYSLFVTTVALCLIVGELYFFFCRQILVIVDKVCNMNRNFVPFKVSLSNDVVIVIFGSLNNANTFCIVRRTINSVTVTTQPVFVLQEHGKFAYCWVFGVFVTYTHLSTFKATTTL